MPPAPTQKVRRRQDNPDPSARRMLNVPAETHSQLKMLADQEGTSMSEIVRYLVEQAVSGKVKIR